MGSNVTAGTQILVEQLVVTLSFDFLGVRQFFPGLQCLDMRLHAAPVEDFQFRAQGLAGCALRQRAGAGIGGICFVSRFGASREKACNE